MTETWRRLDPRLPRDVWLLQIGGVVNSLGNGVLLPFLVIYLHDVRGFGLGISGLIVATSAAAQLGAGLLAGPVIDRIGPRVTLGCGLCLQALGVGLLPLVRVPWQAFVLIAIEGAGSAGFWPSQSTLVARLTPRARRHAAFAQQRLTMNLGIGLGGIIGGLIAHTTDPATFTVLFIVDSLTFFAYVGVLFFVHDPGVAAAEGMAPASYRAVLRHKTFLGLWWLNFLFVAAGYSLTSLFPQFAHDHGQISERQIGIVFAFNTGVIVLAQLPISRWIEGKRRMRALTIMPLVWAVAWLLVDGTGAWLTASAAFVGLRDRLRAVRRRRVLPRALPSGARGGHRARASARPLFRHPLALVGARGNRRACRRRLHSRLASVRALAARFVRAPRRGRGLPSDGALRSGGAAPDPARRGGDSRSAGAGSRLRLSQTRGTI